MAMGCIYAHVNPNLYYCTQGKCTLGSNLYTNVSVFIGYLESLTVREFAKKVDVAVIRFISYRNSDKAMFDQIKEEIKKTMLFHHFT